MISENQEISPINQINKVMSYLEKFNNKSFHHRIMEAGAHYFDQRHFLGIDPFDSTKFKEKYEVGAADKKGKK